MDGAPWITIWTEPRRTIRQIVDTDPTYGVLLLAGLAGALSALEVRWMAMPSHAVGMRWPLMVAFSVVIGAVFGIVALYIYGFFLKWTGAALGGTANYAEVRAALAWSEIPAMVAAAISLLAIIFGVAGPVAGSMMPRRGGGLDFVHLVLGVWSFVLMLKCVGEVHRFSAWRALGAVLLILLVMVLIVFALLAAGVSFGHLAYHGARV